MNELKRTTKALHALLTEQGYTGTYNQLLHLTARARGCRSWQELAAQATQPPTPDGPAYLVIETVDNTVRQARPFQTGEEAAAYAQGIADECGYTQSEGQADWYAEERDHSGVCAFDVHAQQILAWPDNPGSAAPDLLPQVISAPAPTGLGSTVLALTHLRRRYGPVLVLSAREELCQSLRGALADTSGIQVIAVTHAAPPAELGDINVVVWLDLPPHAARQAADLTRQSAASLIVEFTSDTPDR